MLILGQNYGLINQTIAQKLTNRAEIFHICRNNQFYTSHSYIYQIIQVQIEM
ncbi:hypothetical protein FWK35_00008370 [Aphis craccivora]|uniref:Uncharacterized protein n=1 Tax=Aphis craccivora TaxID=307492 RepID=A0A6G0Z1Z9_APHCR|nr:hypothetical protein FWK35_00008370 [Aphis craccivora]